MCSDQELAAIKELRDLSTPKDSIDATQKLTEIVKLVFGGCTIVCPDLHPVVDSEVISFDEVWMKCAAEHWFRYMCSGGKVGPAERMAGPPPSRAPKGGKGGAPGQSGEDGEDGFTVRK